MKVITIMFPDAMKEQQAITYASGAFNPHQNDYQKLEKGHLQGEHFSYRDDQRAYMYRAQNGGYVLKLFADK